MKNEYYLALLLPEHIGLTLRRGKTLAFQKTGDETFYKTPCAIILGKTDLKDPPRNSLQINLTPKKEPYCEENKTYIVFENTDELLSLQKKYCTEPSTMGIPLSLRGSVSKFTLPAFSVSKVAIIIEQEEGFIIKR